MKLKINFSFGDTIGKDTDFKNAFKTEEKMETEYDNRVEEHQKMQNGRYKVKNQNDEEVDNDDETSRKNAMRSHFSSLNLSNSKRILKYFRILLDGSSIKVFITGIQIQYILR